MARTRLGGGAIAAITAASIVGGIGVVVGAVVLAAFIDGKVHPLSSFWDRSSTPIRHLGIDDE